MTDTHPDPEPVVLESHPDDVNPAGIPPAPSSIRAHVPDIDAIQNGEIRVIARECGTTFGVVQGYFKWAGRAAELEADREIAVGHGVDLAGFPEPTEYDGPVDLADLNYALGVIALRRAGYTATEDRADRVTFVLAGAEVDLGPLGSRRNETTPTA